MRFLNTDLHPHTPRRSPFPAALGEGPEGLSGPLFQALFIASDASLAAQLTSATSSPHPSAQEPTLWFSPVPQVGTGPQSLPPEVTRSVGRALLPAGSGQRGRASSLAPPAKREDGKRRCSRHGGWNGRWKQSTQLFPETVGGWHEGLAHRKWRTSGPGKSPSYILIDFSLNGLLVF